MKKRRIGPSITAQIAQALEREVLPKSNPRKIPHTNPVLSCVVDSGVATGIWSRESVQGRGIQVSVQSWTPCWKDLKRGQGTKEEA
jgi:hypothetical protein